jgi:arsenite oxidase large subunit
MISAAPYPLAASPDVLDGVRVPMNLDLALLRGEFRMAWVIGCTWLGGGSAHPHALFETVRQKTSSAVFPQLAEAQAFPRGRGGGVDVAYVVATLRARADAGGMVLVQQDIYPQAQTALADVVLPAASWGEAPFTRMQGERRLRLYSQLADAPGQTLPDWQIIARVAKAMGYSGFDWPDANAVFEEAAARSRGTEHDYTELVAIAREQGRRAHDVLEELGTTGIQCPIKRAGGALEGTIRLHESGFSTVSGKALFVRADYAALVEPRQARFAPRSEELWIINRRSGSTWSSMVEDQRVPYRRDQLPRNILELHPQDAQRLGITTGGEVVVSTDGLLDPSLAGRGLPDSGFFRARAVVSDAMQPGVACTYFNFTGTPEFASNAVVPNVRDPVSNLFSFKLGRGSVRLA